MEPTVSELGVVLDYLDFRDVSRVTTVRVEVVGSKNVSIYCLRDFAENPSNLFRKPIPDSI